MAKVEDIRQNTPSIGSKFIRISDNKIFTVVQQEIMTEQYTKMLYRNDDAVSTTESRLVGAFDLLSEPDDNNPEETIKLQGVRWGPWSERSGFYSDTVNALGGELPDYTPTFNWYLADSHMIANELPNVTLAYMDFSRADLRFVNFSGARLYKCIFTGANLKFATMGDVTVLNCIGLDDATGIDTTVYEPQTTARTRIWRDYLRF